MEKKWREDRLTVLFYRRGTVTKNRRMCDSHENFCERHKNWFQYGEVYRPLLSGISQKERAKGTSKNAIDVNDYIDETNIQAVQAVFRKCSPEGVVLTAQNFTTRFFTIGVHKVVERMLITTFQEHNQECLYVGGGAISSFGTIKKYETITRLLLALHQEEIWSRWPAPTSLDRDFVHGFEMYLKNRPQPAARTQWPAIWGRWKARHPIQKGDRASLHAKAYHGAMLEWLKRHAWKACIRQKRIPSSNLGRSGPYWPFL